MITGTPLYEEEVRIKINPYRTNVENRVSS